MSCKTNNAEIWDDVDKLWEAHTKEDDRQKAYEIKCRIDRILSKKDDSIQAIATKEGVSRQNIYQTLKRSCRKLLKRIKHLYPNLTYYECFRVLCFEVLEIGDDSKAMMEVMGYFSSDMKKVIQEGAKRY